MPIEYFDKGTIYKYPVQSRGGVSLGELPYAVEYIGVKDKPDAKYAEVNQISAAAIDQSIVKLVLKGPVDFIDESADDFAVTMQYLIDNSYEVKDKKDKKEAMEFIASWERDINSIQ